MIGKLWLKFRRFGAPDSLLKRNWQGLLYIASEFESLTLRPNHSNHLRRAFLRSKGVEFGLPCYFGKGFRLFKGAALTIGKRACFGENCGIYVHADISIGEDFLAAPGLTINNGSHELATLQPRSETLSIGHRVWCGVNVTLVAGAQIGDDCVIGSNSLVMGRIPANSVALGSPAKVIRTNIRSGAKVWSCYDGS
jgi:acetyltransferase-like isoleucine patch superfamily enzyme